MSIFRKTLRCAVLAALSTCALAGCGKQDAANETAATSSEAPSAAITETISESTTAPEQTSVPETVEAQPAETEPPSSEALSVDASTPYGQHGALHVENGKLTDENGNTVQLYGMSTHGIAWFPQYINYDSLRTLRDDWNTNCIRLAMYTAEYGGYCAGGDKEQLKQLVKDGVSYATELGMYVIVDWHILSDCDPNQNKDEAIAFFREMAEVFANNDNVLYEICNEPNGGTSWDSIKSYAEEVIPVIRAQKPNAVILVGTPTWSQEIDKAAASPLDDSNVMYTLHFYAGTHKDDPAEPLRDLCSERASGICQRIWHVRCLRQWCQRFCFHHQMAGSAEQVPDQLLLLESRQQRRKQQRLQGFQHGTFRLDRR